MTTEASRGVLTYQQQIATTGTKFLSGTAYGNYQDADWSLDDATGATRVVTRYVRFPEAFSSQPMVVIGLTNIDAHRDFNMRISVEATDITKEGFNAKFTTWSNSITYGIRVSWLAIGQ